MAELDHRVKNVLARVVAVAECTRQGGGSNDQFIRSFNGRIQSMAAAHTLLSQTGWHGADLAALVRNQLAPYTTDANMTIVETDIMLGAPATQALALVLHELVTNAVKYGALSIPGGTVSVSWDQKLNGNASTKLMFIWRELAGPPVTAQIHPGYGTNLIRNLIPHELGGSVDLAFIKEGVNCLMSFLWNRRDPRAVVMAAVGPTCDIRDVRSMSAIGGQTGLVLLPLSLAALDPLPEVAASHPRNLL